MGDLTNDFSWSEFACHCGCGSDYIDVAFVNALQRIRYSLRRAVIITSGVRCNSYNRKVGGIDSSAHTKGLAVDIQCETSRERFELLVAAVDCGFTRIGVGADFIHLDMDKTKPTEVIWLY